MDQKPYQFMEPVVTPWGDGLFIGTLTDGISCQVAMKLHGIQKNPIFRLVDIARPNTGKKSEKPTPQPELVSSAVDMATDTGGTACTTPEI